MFWDHVAWIYDVFANGVNRKANRALCAAVEAAIHPGDDVLECACGTGLLSGVIAGKCKSLVATDCSANMLKRAQKKYANRSNIVFEQANILQLGYPTARFDAVVAANVIHLLDKPYTALQTRRQDHHPYLYEPNRQGRHQQGIRHDWQGGRGLQARVYAGLLSTVLCRRGLYPCKLHPVRGQNPLCCSDYSKAIRQKIAMGGHKSRGEIITCCFLKD